jgi:hypothetical protein
LDDVNINKANAVLLERDASARMSFSRSRVERDRSSFLQRLGSSWRRGGLNNDVVTKYYSVIDTLFEADRVYLPESVDSGSASPAQVPVTQLDTTYEEEGGATEVVNAGATAPSEHLVVAAPPERGFDGSDVFGG